jgi:DNA polymerase-4
VNQNNKIWKSKKIIHIDMDSFYASIEISEKPFLKDKPVAVGGKPTERGVLTTCNYIARRYGIHSAMSSKKAMSLCKKLIILPVDVEKYKTISKKYSKFLNVTQKK